MDKQNKCFVMKEQQRSFAFCCNHPRCSLGWKPLGSTGEMFLAICQCLQGYQITLIRVYYVFSDGKSL